MIKKKIYLHIGLPKTGTTSLQYFFEESKEQLLSEGVLFSTAARIAPVDLTVHNSWGKKRFIAKNESLVGHHILAWTLLGHLKNMSTDKIWGLTIAEIEESDAHSFIISSELFHSLKIEKIKDIANYLKNYEVVIVLYIRDLFDWVLSSYNQMIKTGHGTSTFQEFVDARPDVGDVYENVRKRWASVFGEKQVKVISLDDIDSSVSGSLEKSFIQLLEINDTHFEPFFNKAKLANKSVNPKMTSLLRFVNIVEERLGGQERFTNLFIVLRQHIGQNDQSVRVLLNELIACLDSPSPSDDEKQKIQKLFKENQDVR